MRIKRRLTAHFLLQFIMTFVATLSIFVLLIFVILHFVTKDELDSNPQKAIVETLPLFSFVYDDETVVIKEKWEDILKGHGIWMQLVNENGQVVYEINTPDRLQKEYTINDLLYIEETNKLDTYTVETYFESWQQQPYYYLFGYLTEQETLLQDWYDSYADEGSIDETDMATLEKEVKKQGGMLEIYKNGKLLYTIGEKITEPKKQLEVIGSMYEPGNYETKTYVVNDQDKNSSWILYEKNKTFKDTKIVFNSNTDMYLLFITPIISLIIAIILSIWSGYRYGTPLLLLINWLKIVEKRQYEDVLSGKEHKKIYKKNGKVKFRYRLYKEVFESFSAMSGQLALTEQKRKQLDKTREEWMAGISHDLRTPLTSIQGYGHMLESDQYEYTKEELQQIGKVIRNKTDYMVELVNDFSLIFQLKNSVVTLNKEAVDLSHFVRGVVEKYKNDMTLNEYTFSFEAPAQPCETAVDPKWFVRVLDNVLSNAMKHNPPQTMICVQVTCENSKTKVSIADNGKGMDEQFVNNLFNRYFRGTSTSGRTDGEGLGMSIAYAIVELHGGEIYVKSELGKGTEVVIQL